MILDNLKKANKIAILWYGREGKSSLNFLLKNWIKEDKITILDKNEIKIDFKWNTVFWDNYLKNLKRFDFIIKSPWISSYLDELKDTKIITQAMIFFDIYKDKIISITQTKWKSTTRTLIYNLLKNSWYNAKIVWNIWKPVLDEIDFEKKYDFVIFELSSYMLEDLKNYHHSFISILWNIYPDHLDWHKNFENYKNAKLNILKNSQNILIWFNLYPKIQKHLLNLNFFTFGSEWAYYSHKKNKYYINWVETWIILNPKIPWNHNLDNFSRVLWVCHLLWIDYNIFSKTVNEFEWLPHRLQNIWTFNWITFIDDAISTTPESTIAWIKTFKKWLVNTIFLGWTDRWYDFKELIDVLIEYNIKNIVLFPDSGKKIKILLDNNLFNIFETNSMKEAVNFAYKYTSKQKICLLSTASPSYSLWKNFEHKWNEFKKEILLQQKGK